MFLVDTSQGRIIADDEIKRDLASRIPTASGSIENQIKLGELPAGRPASTVNSDEPLLKLQRTFGYTLEDLRILLAPMATDGYEAIGSMGNDTPLAVLSDRPQLLYNYFKQLFAQVTNPPLDAIREEIITSLVTTIGSEGNLLEETPEQCRLLRLEQPILTNGDLARIRQLDRPGFKSRTLSILFPRAEGAAGMQRRLDALRSEASQAMAEGVTILILSDRGVNSDMVPIPALLATSGVHHHLIREGSRTRCGIVVETGEAREVHHFALLTGYGAGAVNPYLAFATLHQMQDEGYAARRLLYGEARKELHQGDRQGTAQGDVQDGHLDAAELSRCADLRGDRPELANSSTSTSLAPPAASRASASTRSPMNRFAATSTPIRATDVPRDARSGRRRTVPMAAQGRGPSLRSRRGRQTAASHTDQ